MNNTKVLILAGGLGKRLWPLSRKKWPKFMLELKDNKSLLQMAYERLSDITDRKNRFVVTTKDIDFLVNKNIRKIDKGFSSDNIFKEPCARNTAPAIMMAINHFDDDDLVVVLPADHIIEPNKQFIKTIRRAIEVAEKNFIVSVGIKPDYPATGYGYIKKSEKSIADGWKIDEFKEKPDKKTAKEYLKSGGYFWNAGIFVFKAGVMKKEMKKHSSEIYSCFQKLKDDRSNLKQIYEKLPNISIDYAVMEKTEKAAVVCFKGKWNDLGSWEAVKDVLSKNNEVFSNGEQINIDSRNSFVFTRPKKLTAVVGLKDTIVIDTEDAILAMKQGQGQKVKKVVKKIRNRSQAVRHLTDFRPWGGYKVLDAGKNYKIKILTVSPGQRLSLQKHKYRDEIWTVIQGKALITLGNKNIELKEKGTVEIKAGVTHRAENKGEDDLKILEMAIGQKILEDDIVRLEDDYKRE